MWYREPIHLFLEYAFLVRWTKTKNDFFHFVEIPVGVNFFIPCRETGLAYTKNLSFFGKCALTLTNSIPLPDFPTRDTGNQYPISENPTGKKWGFLHKNSLGLPEKRFYLLKHIIRREANHNLYIRREIRRRIKKIFTDHRKLFSDSTACFFIRYRSGNQQVNIKRVFITYF